MVSLLRSRFQCRHANGRRSDPKNGCERNEFVVDEEQLCRCASSNNLYFILFCCYLPSKTSHAELNFNDCYQSSTDKIAFFFFLFSHFFHVGVALVLRSLFESSSILCQETLWQKGTGTNNSAREEHTSQTQSGNNLLPMAQFTRAY